MSVRVPVTFTPAGLTAWVAEGSVLLEAARATGVVIPAPCGGRGVCGRCGVFVDQGRLLPPDEHERAALKHAPPGVRLACRARVSSEPVTVRPVVSLASVRAGEEIGPDEDCVAGVDLGTTTVAAVIVGTRTGRELGRASVPNLQQSFGADVLSRLQIALDDGAAELRDAAEQSVRAALEAACGRAGQCLERISRVVIAGNTAMTALLAGVDVRPLATSPFELPTGGLSYPPDGDLRHVLAAAAEVALVQPIASFVGGDVVAGLLQAGLVEEWDRSVYVDLGTNAEIVVGTKGGMLVSSAAAGPAFEGAGIAFGGAAAPGAVQRVGFDGSSLLLDVIGGGEPGWFCGSGLMSLVATLRRVGHVAADGLLVAEGPLSSQFDRVEGILGFRLHEGGPYLLQTDVRAFQMAKAAVAAALFVLLRASGIRAKKIERVLVAGAFGSGVDGADLVELGVLPAEFSGKAESVGNASLAGAASMAFDKTAREDAARVVAACTHVSLADNDVFKKSYVPATALQEWTVRRGWSS